MSRVAVPRGQGHELPSVYRYRTAAGHHENSFVMNQPTPKGRFATPVVREMRVVPVAGHDCMLLNLSGAHAPLFTRNLVILKDSSGRIGAGEVPGGESIRR